jgi:hypothetical protein
LVEEFNCSFYNSFGVNLVRITFHVIYVEQVNYSTLLSFSNVFFSTSKFKVCVGENMKNKINKEGWKGGVQCMQPPYDQATQNRTPYKKQDMV